MTENKFTFQLRAVISSQWNSNTNESTYEPHMTARGISKCIAGCWCEYHVCGEKFDQLKCFLKSFFMLMRWYALPNYHTADSIVSSMWKVIQLAFADEKHMQMERLQASIFITQWKSITFPNAPGLSAAQHLASVFISMPKSETVFVIDFLSIATVWDSHSSASLNWLLATKRGHLYSWTSSTSWRRGMRMTRWRKSGRSPKL